MRLSSSLLIILVFSQLLIFTFLLSVFNLINISLDSYGIILFIVFIECLILAFLDKKDSIYKLFLFMMFLFNLALPFFVIFGLYSYPLGNRIMLTDGIMTPVSDKTLSITYLVLIAMLMGSSVGWLIGKYQFDNNLKHSTQTTIYGARFNRIIKYLFFILTAMVMYRNLTLLYFSSVYDFIEVMHVRSVNLGIPWIFTIADIFFKMSGFAMLYLSKNHKEYIKYALIFMAPFIIQAFTGARGETIAMIIVVTFIYSHFYKQFNMVKIFSYGIVLFFSAIVIDALRFSREISSLLENISVFDLFFNVVASTSGSVGVIAYTIELQEEFFNRIPFLFGYIQGIFSFSPNYTVEGIQNKNYLAQHLTYIMEPDKLLNGSTIGTAMGAEFYEFVGGSIGGIFILSGILLYFTKYFMSRINRNIVMFYIGALYLEALLLAPRGSIMKIFSKESLVSILVLIFLVSLSNKYFKFLKES